MFNTIVHPEETIDRIREAGRLTASLRDQLCSEIKVGMSTLEIDNMAKEIIASMGAESAFYGYQGFPGQICISINSEVIHGYGKKDVFINDQDIVTIDCGVKKNGCLADSARTISMSEPTELTKLLFDFTEKSLDAGIKAAVAGNTVSDIGQAIYNCIKSAPTDFGIIRAFCGHGVGTAVHQPPQIPNFPSGITTVLRKGMVIAIEPMITIGGEAVYVDSDGWTARTQDESLSAHFEHTILITDGEPEILTSQQKEVQK